jgi:stage III sporulation protein AG
MVDKMDGIKNSLKSLIKSPKKTKLLIILAFIGIMLIALSSMPTNKATEAAAEQSDAEYCAGLEEKIKELVTAITGNESCVVAVTLENSGEYVYANQNKIDLDQTEDKNDTSLTTKESRKSEEQYIIVKGKDGTQTALIVTEKKPSIRGVAIVAGGINNMNYDLISSCISSMLGIASRKISISEAG